VSDPEASSEGTLLVSFDLLGEEVDFSPGQYFFVTLADIGYQDDKGLRRHITVVTSPNERHSRLRAQRSRGRVLTS
jgi:ferredoxin-NADP reductase